MAAGERITIQMTGGSPWGFRLYGGDDDPLVVAKLRKRSKAHEAGLMEGDALLGINGYSCEKITHGTAMGLIESSTDLTLIVLRGASTKDAVYTAIQTLGSELQPVTAAVKTATQTKTLHLSPAPSPTVTQTTAPSQNQVVNGYDGPDQYTRQEQTFQEGDRTTHVITETSRERLGDTSVTKVCRETVTEYGGRKTMFSVPDVTSGLASAAASKPGVWTPPSGGATGAPRVVSAPSGVQVQHNPDRSITMTIGLHGPSALDGQPAPAPAPGPTPANIPPMFKVKKFGANAPDQKPKPAVWTPSGGPPPANPPETAASGREDTNTGQDDDLKLLPEEEAQLKAHLESLKKPLPSLLQKVLIDGSGSDREGTPDSPGYLSRRRIEQFASDYETEEERNKRKMFADSAFYDDPEHKYPTIEEQVKMARKVAMSLLAPANKKARGHRMFMRRMVKSQKWTTDQNRREKDFEWDDGDDEEKYYNPNPWSASSSTWQPSKPADVGGGGAKKPDVLQQPPPPPPVPTSLIQTAAGFSAGPRREDGKRALSAEEFERMRLFEAKTDHTQVSPALCFSLAEDLRNMKGKGGKLFAKRVARAEKWVVDEGQSSASKPNPELIQKIAMQAAAAAGTGAGPSTQPTSTSTSTGAAPTSTAGRGRPDDGPVVNRLKDMIDPPKPKMSPWEAAATNDGDVERAFDHLKGYDPYGRTTTGQLATSLDTAVQKSSYAAAPPSGAPVTELPAAAGDQSTSSKLPDFTRKIKPWNASDHGSSAAAAGPRPAPAAPSSGGSAGFRPVNFRPLTGGASSAMPSGQSAITSGGEAASVGGGEDVGYCDL